MLLYFKLNMGNFNGTHVILSVSFVGFVHKIIRTFQEPGHLPEVIKFNRMARDSNSGNWKWMLFGEKKAGVRGAGPLSVTEQMFELHTVKMF